MNVTVYVPDQLWHQFKRAYPGADVEMAFRQWMRDWVADSAQKAVERRATSDALASLRGRR